jgi:hypothetical protein
MKEALFLLDSSQEFWQKQADFLKGEKCIW